MFTKSLQFLLFLSLIFSLIISCAKEDEDDLTGPVNRTTVTNKYSVSLDGDGDYVTGADVADVMGASFSKITVSGWIKVDETVGNSHSLISFGDNSGGTSKFRMNYLASGKFTCTVDIDADGSGIKSAYTEVVTDPAAWNHFACSWDRVDSTDNIKIYINGQPSTDMNTTATEDDGDFTSDAEIYLGQWNAAASTQFEGAIDEVAVWDEALSAAEIAAIYNEGKATFNLDFDSGDYESSDNLVAWWRMGDAEDATTSTTISDSKGSADLTLQGDAAIEADVP